jgi:hypothetical protein
MDSAPVKAAHLIGHRDEERQQEHVAVPGELLLDVLLGQRQEVPDHAGQERNGHHEVVAVGLDEVVPGYGRRIDVVFPERTQEIFAQDRELHRAPSVRRPVHQPGAEVGGDDAAERRHHQRAQVVQPDVEHDEEEVDHHQSDADAHADALLRPFTGAVQVGQLLGALVLGAPPRPRLLLLGDGAVGVRVVLQHRVLVDLLLGLDGRQDLVGHDVQVLVGEDLLDALRAGQREGHRGTSLGLHQTTVRYVTTRSDRGQVDFHVGVARQRRQCTLHALTRRSSATGCRRGPRTSTRCRASPGTWWRSLEGGALRRPPLNALNVLRES